MSTRFVLGRYLDESVIIDSSTDYINATQLCRRLTDWQKTSMAKDQIRYFTTNMKCLSHEGKPSYEVTHEEASHMQLASNIRDIIVGTYYHRYLINLMMQWISPVYALKSAVIVDEYVKIRNEASTRNRTNDQDIDRLKEVHTIVTNIQELVNTIKDRLDNQDDTTVYEVSSNGSTVLIG